MSRSIHITVTPQDVERSISLDGYGESDSCPIACAIKRHRKRSEAIEVLDSGHIRIGLSTKIVKGKKNREWVDKFIKYFDDKNGNYRRMLPVELELINGT